MRKTVYRMLLGLLAWVGATLSNAQAQRPSAAYVHVVTACNTGIPSMTRLNHPDLNGQVTAHLQVTAEYPVSDKPIGVYYDGQYWNIVNEDESPLAVDQKFHVVIVQNDAGSGHSLVARFLHTVTTTGTTSAVTQTQVNASANYQLFVTNNQSGLRTDGAYVQNKRLPLVSWNAKNRHHLIGSEDPGLLVRNASYNVLVAESKTARFSGQALVAAPANAVLLVSRFLNENDSTALRLKAPLSVRYESAQKGWRVYQGSALAPASLTLNIAVFSTNNPGAVETNPNPPGKLAVSDLTATQATLSWGAGTGLEKGYEVQYSTDHFKTVINTFSAAGNTSSYRFSSLNPRTAYSFRVRGYHESPWGRCYSGYSEVVSATTLAPPVTIPSAPTGLSAVGVSSRQIDLRWTNTASNATGIQLERSTDGTVFAVLATLPNQSAAYADTGLAPLIRYFYRIRAQNSAGSSAYSNVADATTKTDISNELIAPGPLVAMPEGMNEVNLTWAYKSTAGEVFEVWKSTESATEGFMLLTVVPLTTTTFTDRNLRQQTRFFYKVRVRQNTAFSVFSNTALALTSPVTGVAPAPEMVSMRVYPNPTAGVLQLDLSRPLSERAGVRIFTPTGQLIQEETLEPFQTGMRFSLGQLTTGHYLLILSGKNVQQTATLIKN